MRCFVALDVPDATLQLAQRVRAAVTSIDGDWQAEKWVDLGNLHVTLAFLGEVDDSDVSGLITRLGFNAIRPFALSMPSLWVHPDPNRVSMLWLRYGGGVADSVNLAGFVRGCASDSGMLQDSPVRRFVPHVTLVRTRKGRRLADEALSTARGEVERSQGQIVSVPSIKVFSSSLGRSGPTYKEIATVPLLGSGSG